MLFSLLHLLERYRPVPIVVELLDDRLYLLHCQVLPSQLKLALVVMTAVRLGGTKSSGVREQDHVLYVSLALEICPSLFLSIDLKTSSDRIGVLPEDG